MSGEARPRRGPTLFVRLLLVQALTSLLLLFVFSAVFYVERNRTVAYLVAERWLPALRERMACMACPGPVLVAAEPPRATVHTQNWAPRIVVLLDTLRRGGVPAQAVAVGLPRVDPVIWIQVAPDRWLGVRERLIEPRLPLRLVVMLGLALLVLGLVSWMLARHLSRPLEQLRRRIEDPTVPAPATAGGTVEMAEIEAAWDAAQHRLAEQSRERQLMLAGISHDLRSPLARIRMAAELLPETPDTGPRRATIVRNVAVADRLLESFLDHVRAGELPLDQSVDLAERARAAALAFEAHGGDLRLEVPARLVLQKAHPTLIDRLLSNLLDNALRHGKPPVLLRLQADPRQVRLDVVDAGPGIPDHQQAEALRAFSRGDTSRSQPGTGLGLAVVRQIVERLGGRLSFERSAEGHAVRIALPRN